MRINADMSSGTMGDAELYVSAVELEETFISLRSRANHRNSELLLQTTVAMELAFAILHCAVPILSPDARSRGKDVFLMSLNGRLQVSDFLYTRQSNEEYDAQSERIAAFGHRVVEVRFPMIRFGATGSGHLSRLTVTSNVGLEMSGINKGGTTAAYMDFTYPSALNLAAGLAREAGEFCPRDVVRYLLDRATQLFDTGVDPAPVARVTGWPGAVRPAAEQDVGINVDDLLPPRM